MADTAIAITAGSGTNVDTRTEGTNGNHRQVIVIGDPSTNAGVAPVDATAGLKVDLGADNDVTIASLPALAAGTNNIGDVDVLTINGVAPAFGSGVRGPTVQRVTIATDDSVPVTGTFYQATQPVSAASLPLPSGASTAAKQPALGTAGTASADVITVQGIASMTALKVDGSAVTQPVSGPVTDAQLRATAVPVSLASVPSHAVTNAGTFAVQAAGDVAHDAVDSGAPVKIGGVATSSQQTAVASGDRVNTAHTLNGSPIVAPYTTPENIVSGAITTAMTGTTSTSLVAAPGAGLRNYITTLIVSNAHATVGTDVVIQDGSGGTTLMTIPAAAAYGGAVINLPVPLKQPTANTALFCANVTTGASTKVSAIGFKAA